MNKKNELAFLGRDIKCFFDICFLEIKEMKNVKEIEFQNFRNLKLQKIMLVVNDNNEIECENIDEKAVFYYVNNNGVIDKLKEIIKSKMKSILRRLIETDYKSYRSIDVKMKDELEEWWERRFDLYNYSSDKTFLDYQNNLFQIGDQNKLFRRLIDVIKDHPKERLNLKESNNYFPIIGDEIKGELYLGELKEILNKKILNSDEKRKDIDFVGKNDDENFEKIQNVFLKNPLNDKCILNIVSRSRKTNNTFYLNYPQLVVKYVLDTLKESYKESNESIYAICEGEWGEFKKGAIVSSRLNRNKISNVKTRKALFYFLKFLEKYLKEKTKKLKIDSEDYNKCKKLLNHLNRALIILENFSVLENNSFMLEFEKEEIDLI